MKHHRSPTQSYPQDMVTIHATLASRHPHLAIPTLLSPLRSITNTPPAGNDIFDDFQSNAWLNTPPYRSLSGLGITYYQDAFANSLGRPLVPEDPALHIQVDGDQGLPSLHSRQHGSYQDLELEENYRMEQCTPSFVPHLCDEPAGHLLLGLGDDMDSTASEAIGLIPDVNLYDKLRELDTSYPGINPLDTVCGTSLQDIGTYYAEPASPTPEDRRDNDAFPMTESRAEQSPSPRVIQDIMSILIQPAPEFPFLPRASANSPPTQSLSPSHLAASRSSVSIKFSPTRDQHLPAVYDIEYPNTHSSPVLNAHLGIELNALISRADRFRTKYPERDIDRAWLSHFAGKLSDRGELLNDFRCYVIGCDQRNKRRDHILVHVGAHIGQRPFACSMCRLRFLRKNECKRHEASHSGFRPYSCDICGQSFVRQDLVKRHVKRTHGLRDESESGVPKQTRKRARLV